MATAAWLRIAVNFGVAFALSSAPAQANLIINESLEFGSGGPPNGGFVILDEGSTSITGWTVGEFGVDWDNDFWQAAGGSHSVDLNGSFGPGSLRQVISTIVGQQYLLSFALSGNPQRFVETGEPTGSVSLAVSADGTLDTFSFDVLLTQTVANMNWVERSLKFVATSNTTQITFQSTTASNCCYGPVLDNVSVVPVPEPSTIALIAIALLSLFGISLLRGRASATALLVAASSMSIASSASASLLTPAYEAQLATWLGKGPLTFTKIYHGTSGESHFNGAAWHAAVDGKGATFSLMQVLPGTYESCRIVYVFGNPQCHFQRDLLIESAMVVGGFNPQSWNSSGSYNVVENDADRTAFIFNLSIGILQRQLRSFDINGSAGRFQTYNAVHYGPVFGDGFDLGFSYSDFDLTEGHTYPLSYDALNGQSILGISYGGGRNPGYVSSLKFGALETYTFVLGSPSSNDVPEPSTTALFGMALLSLFCLGMMRRRAEA